MTVELLDYMGGDKATMDAARVSFSKEANNFTEEQNIKLIHYLAKHNHWSPFSHSFLKFRIKAPVFVSRQLAKHQVGLAWNEVSRRYVDDEPEFFFPDVWRGKPINAKQGSEGIVDLTNITMDDSGWSLTLDEAIYQYAELQIELYTRLIQSGVAPEQSRIVLPINTMTEWIWSGSLYAFARVCNLRLDSHAQSETRDVAKLINNLIPETFKHSWNALIKKEKQQ